MVSDEENDALEDFAGIFADPPAKRESCERCDRPFTVCYCSQIVAEPLSIHNNLIVLQDPREVKRCLRTTKILELSLHPDRFHLYRGKRFGVNKYAELHRLLSSPELENVLVWPSLEADSVKALPSWSQLKQDAHASKRGYNIVLLDGTWHQARALYNSNKFVKEMRCIKLDNSEPSKYVIRTQPTETCLSTVEAAGLVLAHLEDSPIIMEHFSRPLNAICDYQLKQGAVKHQSKEFMITNGCYPKALSRRVTKQLDEGKIKLNHLI